MAQHREKLVCNLKHIYSFERFSQDIRQIGRVVELNGMSIECCRDATEVQHYIDVTADFLSVDGEILHTFNFNLI